MKDLVTGYLPIKMNQANFRKYLELLNLNYSASACDTLKDEHDIRQFSKKLSSSRLFRVTDDSVFAIYYSWSPVNEGDKPRTYTEHKAMLLLSPVILS
jgi:hypothetical protein